MTDSTCTLTNCLLQQWGGGVTRVCSVGGWGGTRIFIEAFFDRLLWLQGEACFLFFHLFGNIYFVLTAQQVHVHNNTAIIIALHKCYMYVSKRKYMKRNGFVLSIPFPPTMYSTCMCSTSVRHTCNDSVNLLPVCYHSLPGLILNRGNRGNCLRCAWSLPWCPFKSPNRIYKFLIEVHFALPL